MNFEEKFQNLLKYFNDNNIVKEISQKFGSHLETNVMFEHIWHLDVIHNYIEIDKTKIKKCNKISENFRKDGNKHYQKNNFDEALECYNKSIMFANCMSENSTLPSNSLSLGFANSSAVLYKLKYYTECKEVIKASLTHGYPTILKPKLIERFANCCIILRQSEEAKKCLEDYMEEYHTLADQEIKLLEPYKEILVKMQSQCDDSQFLNIDKINKPVCDTRKCEISFTSHPLMPSLSKDVELSYSIEKGRFLTAAKNISPGEVIVSETCYGAAVLHSAVATHCSYCFGRILTPLPCSKCSNVLFCSQKCLEDGKISFHTIECPITELLTELDMGKNANLAFRIIVQTSLSSLKKNVSIYKLEKNDDPRTIGFNPMGQYCSDDYRTVYNLVTNKENRTVGDLFKRGVMAACLVKLLMKTNYFGPSTNAASESDIILVGNTLFVHLMNLPCNAHSINEFQINRKQIEGCSMIEIGAGAFSVLSLFNHSCNPAVARSSCGRKIIARAIRSIQKGEEITDCYGEHFAIHPIHDRQQTLLKQYFFLCSCVACTNKWLLYKNLPTNIFVNCPFCKSVVDLQLHNCSNKSVETQFNTIKSVIDSFKESYSNIVEGNITFETEKSVLEAITLIENHLVAPTKIFFEMQECLKFLFDRQGNRWMVKN